MEGQICWGNDADEKWLKRIGVKLGEEEPNSGGWFKCTMTMEVFKKLEPKWGTFFWTLTVIEAKPS